MIVITSSRHVQS